MAIPPAKLGWMAAILDIKGHVVTKQNKSRATPQIVLIVDSRHASVVRQLCALTGTSVEMKPAERVAEWMRRGCAEHCPEPHQHVDAGFMPATGRWSATGVTAAIILNAVLPYMINTDDDRFRQAYELVLQNATLTGQGAGMARQAVGRMLKLGWPLPEGWAERMMETREDYQPIPEEEIRQMIAEEQARLARKPVRSIQIPLKPGGGK